MGIEKIETLSSNKNKKDAVRVSMKDKICFGKMNDEFS
jgi:hypothetical protein